MALEKLENIVKDLAASLGEPVSVISRGCDPVSPQLAAAPCQGNSEIEDSGIGAMISLALHEVFHSVSEEEPYGSDHHETSQTARELSTAMARIACLEASLETEREATANIRRGLDSALAAGDAASAELKRLEEDCQGSWTELRAARSEMRVLEESIAEIEEARRAASKRLEEQKEELRELRTLNLIQEAALSEARDGKDLVDSELAKARSELNTLRQTVLLTLDHVRSAIENREARWKQIDVLGATDWIQGVSDALSSTASTVKDFFRAGETSPAGFHPPRMDQALWDLAEDLSSRIESDFEVRHSEILCLKAAISSHETRLKHLVSSFSLFCRRESLILRIFPDLKQVRSGSEDSGFGLLPPPVTGGEEEDPCLPRTSIRQSPPRVESPRQESTTIISLSAIAAAASSSSSSSAKKNDRSEGDEIWQF